MLINTKFLGEIEIDEKDIIDFSYGLPGFQHLHKFVIIPAQDNNTIYYLQSAEDSRVCFITVMPVSVMGEYDIDISEDAVNELEIENEEDVFLLSILNIPENPKDMTVNLRAPIIINMANGKAAQELLEDDKYDMKHKIYKGD